MTVLVFLLRGVNVGGRHVVKMEELRRLFETMGFEKPQTYVQTGNIVCATRRLNVEKLAAPLEDALEQMLGFRPAVFVRTRAEMRDVVAGNPFADQPDIDASKLLVTFFSHEVDREIQEKVASLPRTTEDVRISGREMYIYFPDGIGRSKLAARLADKRTAGTARNWNTVRKLLEMAEAMVRK